MAEQQVEVKPRRPVYRSYAEVLRMLVGEAERRIRADTTRDPIPKLSITPRMRALQRGIVTLRKMLKKQEQELKLFDGVVTSGGSLERSYESRRALEEKPSQARERRLQKLRALKAEAILDTIDLSPAEAKVYFRRFEQKLRKV